MSLPFAPRTFRSLAFALVAGAVLAGCGGDSASPGAGTEPPAGASSGTFARIQAEVFNTQCVSCHRTGDPLAKQSALVLTADGLGGDVRAALTKKFGKAVVFAAHADPIGAGVVESLARPGGNITGISVQQTDIAGKRLELLRAIVPNLGRLAFMTNVGAPGAVPERREVEVAARMLGLEVIASEVRQAKDIAPAIEALKSRVDALYVYTDPLMATHRTRLNILAQGARLATIYGNREYVDAGGLMSYGVNYANQFRRTAQIVDKILRGTSPADIPVEQPTTFELVVNLKTARALGLAIPEYLLQRADEVIE